jgi:two-component sensor histidine kinase
MDDGQGTPASDSCRSLDRLLLDEANHRIANEVTAALAALHIAQSARGHAARPRLMAAAIDRLESFGESSRILAGLSGEATDVGSLLERLCRAMLRSRLGAGPKRVTLDIAPVILDGEAARHLALIAYELINNTLKHAFFGAGSELQIKLKIIAGSLVLVVADDGPGITAESKVPIVGQRLGRRILKDLVKVCNGHLEIQSSVHGTIAQVAMPLSEPF